MKNTEWEFIDDLQNRYNTLLRNDSEIENITSYILERGENLELICEFTSDNIESRPLSKLQSRRDKHPAGTVRIDDSEIDFGSNYSPDNKITLSGMISLGRTTTISISGSSRTKETCRIHRIKSNHEKKNKTAFLIEWVVNLNMSPYIWPNSLMTERRTKTTKTFSSTDHSITLSDDKEQSGLSSKCCHIKIQGFNIYFGVAEESKLNNTQHPGFIFYEGSPDSEFRTKVRQALSFILGRNILYLGNSELDEKLYLVGFEAQTPNSMGGLFIKNPSPPPSRLMRNDSQGFFSDEHVINYMVEKFVLNYDKYDLNHVSWLYWHAVIAPAHLKAVCFGATLESTQKKFIEKNEVSFKHSLVDKKLWRDIAKSLHEIINKNEYIDERSKKTLLNKISNLNSTPQSLLTENFFEVLGLRLGDKEKKAYSRRNDAAHGNKTPDDNFIDLIRDSKLLHILCNRVLISILALTDNYTDFYTLGHPFRKLSEPVSE
ncbi:hypothetical protein PTR67_07380 [Serratia nevei]|uniref:hypothetical protein n=1 Tax=Serratia nevei TaxID=2703794 RepID=UPI00313EE36B